MEEKLGQQQEVLSDGLALQEGPDGALEISVEGHTSSTEEAEAFPLLMTQPLSP